jgi:hypothetical protein
MRLLRWLPFIHHHDPPMRAGTTTLSQLVRVKVDRATVTSATYHALATNKTSTAQVRVGAERLAKIVNRQSGIQTMSQSRALVARPLQFRLGSGVS